MAYVERERCCDGILWGFSVTQGGPLLSTRISNGNSGNDWNLTEFVTSLVFNLLALASHSVTDDDDSVRPDEEFQLHHFIIEFTATTAPAE